MDPTVDRQRGQVARAIDEIARGRPVVVLDDEDRENEGDLVFAAAKATRELVAFMVRHTSGYICVSLPEEDCDRLDLPPMYRTNQDKRATAYAVTVDARHKVTTGISAADRACTIRLLADPAAVAADFTRPGHVVPLRAKPGGVLRRPGHTEAAVDLARMAGLPPAGVLCEIVSSIRAGEMARREELAGFAAQHGLALVTIAELIAYRRRFEKQVFRVAEARLPVQAGQFRVVGYRSTVDDVEHVALVAGELAEGVDVLVGIHSECLMGDLFGSLRCDCRSRLDASLAAVAAQGRGVVLYIRGERHASRLRQTLQAYQLEDAGTVDVNTASGSAVDVPDNGTGAQILVDLGVRSMRLLTDSPVTRAALDGYGLEDTGRLPLEIRPKEENLHYLPTIGDPTTYLLDRNRGRRVWPKAAGEEMS